MDIIFFKISGCLEVDKIVCVEIFKKIKGAVLIGRFVQILK